jgi:glutaredoxin
VPDIIDKSGSGGLFILRIQILWQDLIYQRSHAAQEFTGQNQEERETAMPEKAHVTIYTKPGCHLCDEAKQQMRAADCPDLFELEEINIETNAGLMKRYGMEIPVILINGQEAFRHRLSALEFRKTIAGE